MNVFNIEVILHSDNTVETEKYYKDTNAYDYLPYSTAHSKHCKDNLPYNLAKCINVFVSNDEKVDTRLKELKNWLKGCNYPESRFIMQNYKVQSSLQIIRKIILLFQLIMKI